MQPMRAKIPITMRNKLLDLNNPRRIWTNKLLRPDPPRLSSLSLRFFLFPKRLNHMPDFPPGISGITIALDVYKRQLLKDIAMHIAASDPRYVKPEDVTVEDLEREKEIYRAQAAATGKPAAVIEKIVDGKMAKFYEEVCLLEQPLDVYKRQEVGGDECISSLGS